MTMEPLPVAFFVAPTRSYVVPEQGISVLVPAPGRRFQRKTGISFIVYWRCEKNLGTDYEFAALKNGKSFSNVLMLNGWMKKLWRSCRSG